ncbi:uncharacterized protein LOC100249907 isoform X1 [Vitis vinifera]|uniref:uncharacterized protein LOC100249907 isoform X1 n=1 Tax=Vitis vinifera TaxID=29760 RepID=UPI0028832116|nr:uncharacterized protein LOC100249907 isoform X1 [Vitis vinifera]XP_059594956.1 uncharacterized protein LOC100249907 isoform X1 [Vitis vinifera]
MEDEKKKKKNKKKKNKQHKASEGPAVGVGEEIASLDENHLSTQTHGNQESIADVQNRDVQKENVDLNGHCANGTDSSILVEAEKQKWLQREASLQERIKQLENDKELHTQKESILAEADKKQWLKREATLEERIKQLQDENDLHMQKEAGLEMRIVQLQTEKHSWIQKEATLEGKIQQLLDENSTLSVKWASLEEKVEHQERERNSWVLKENSSREIISSLNDENRKLQGQVMELEEFRINILQENQLLKEKVSSLHLQIKELEGSVSSAHASTEITKVMELEEFRINILQENQLLKEKVSSLQLQIKELEESVSSAHASTEITKHASKHVDLNPQTEAATVLIEKLTSENADLVEKVNELYIELDQLRVAAGLSSAIGLDKKIGALQNSNVADHMSEPTDNSSASSERMESVEAVPIHGQSSQEAVPMHDENSQEAVPIHDQRSLEAVPMLDESSQEAVPIHDQRSIEAVPINDKSPLEAVPMNDERISADIEDVEQTAVIPNSSETDDSGEIVQIPLDENEARELELQAAENDRNTTVPITDAPLIGAPFRFISFVAKYVSGADLVGKSSTNPTVQP